MNKLRSIIFIWFALLGLGFTTVSFYDFNAKLLCVEITEELSEDGADINEEDGNDAALNYNAFLSTNKFMLESKISLNNSINSNAVHSTCKGYILELIKPPLVN